MCERTLEKVTAFITRHRGDRTDLLLFRHPHAGIQIPAGTVEPSERPEDAALREAREETGILDLVLVRHVSSREEPLKENERIVLEGSEVRERPQERGVSRGHLTRGMPVVVQREEKDFTQVIWEEWDRLPDPQYITCSITGWVPSRCLARKRIRHFYHLTSDSEGRLSWPQQADNHVFEPFWAPFQDLPPILPPQDQWLTFALRECGYTFQR